eukprot:scaffold31550_cov60-Phaeocystis_antarctica.AAC.5
MDELGGELTGGHDDALRAVLAWWAARMSFPRPGRRWMLCGLGSSGRSRRGTARGSRFSRMLQPGSVCTCWTRVPRETVLPIQTEDEVAFSNVHAHINTRGRKHKSSVSQHHTPVSETPCSRRSSRLIAAASKQRIIRGCTCTMSRQPRNMAHPALCAQLIAYSALRRASSSLPPGRMSSGSTHPGATCHTGRTWANYLSARRPQAWWRVSAARGK